MIQFPSFRAASHVPAPDIAPGIAVRTKGLAKRFGRGAPVVDALDIDLPSGALSLIKGPSGCGKSTLLAMMAGLTPPDAGKVTLLGHDLWAMRSPARDALRLMQLGFVFQGSILFPALTAVQQVSFVMGHMGLSPEEASARAIAALADVGLRERAHLLPAALSGGEKQRVAIACALAKRPSLIFADEPTSALDTESAAAVSTLMRALVREHGTTVVCVTHDDRLSPYADRIHYMQAGRIADIEILETR